VSDNVEQHFETDIHTYIHTYIYTYIHELRRYVYLVMWQHVVERHVSCQSTTFCHITYHIERHNFTECFNINITLVRYR